MIEVENIVTAKGGMFLEAVASGSHVSGPAMFFSFQVLFKFILCKLSNSVVLYYLLGSSGYE